MALALCPLDHLTMPSLTASSRCAFGAVASRPMQAQTQCFCAHRRHTTIDAIEPEVSR